MSLEQSKGPLPSLLSFLEMRQKKFHRWMECFFEAIGRHVARNPVRTIMISIFATFAIGSITIFMGVWETRLEYRETLHDSSSFRTYVDTVVPEFGNLPRRSELHMKSSSSSDSMLLKENLLASLQLQNDVLALETRAEDGSILSYDDICWRKSDGGLCIYDSIFTRMWWNATVVESMSQANIDEALIKAFSNPDMAMQNLIGNVKISSDGKSISGNSIRFFFYGLNPSESATSIFDTILAKSASKSLENTFLWEEEYLRYTCSGVVCASDVQDVSSWNRTNYEIMAISQRSLADEINRNSSASLPYMVCAINLILIVMWLMLGGKPLRHSRFALGTGAVVMIMFSEIIGFGISSLVGVPLSDLSLILIFVVVGVGVDDVVILVDFLGRQKKLNQQRPSSNSVEDSTNILLIAEAVGRAGPTIFLTSITNLLAFLVAASAGYAGVRWVCITGGIILFVLFVLTVTFFTAILTIDHERSEKKRLDMLCCMSYSDGENRCEEENVTIQEEKDEVRKVLDEESKTTEKTRAYSDEEQRQNLTVESLDVGLPSEVHVGIASSKDEEPRRNNNEPNTFESTFFLQFVRGWTKILSNKALSGVIIVAFVSLIPIGFFFTMPKLKIGSNIQDYFPDDSYYSSLAEHVRESHEAISGDSAFIIKDVSFDEPSTRAQISRIVSALNSDSLVLSSYQSMFQDFDGFVDVLSSVFKDINFDELSTFEKITKAVSVLNSFGLSLSPNHSMLQDYDSFTALISSNETSGDSYLEGLDMFLQITSPVCVRFSTSAESESNPSCERVVIPADYNNEIVWSTEDGKKSIKIVRMLGMISYSVDTYESVMRMNQHRETLANTLQSLHSNEIGDGDVTLWSYGWMAFDREAKMKVMIVHTLIYAALTVLAVVAMFLHPISVLIIAVGIASIDGALFIIMYLSGVSIDAPSFLCITMSIGFSVDYGVHVAHAYEHSGDDTESVIERLTNALSGVGKSVTKGGVSTFTGIFVLAFAKAAIFRTFFKLLFSTVILGLSISLIFFPACIVFVGKWIKARA